ncbi:MAG: carboxymuconolactone decarboxylase family protein [Actinomycetota bacterium]
MTRVPIHSVLTAPAPSRPALEAVAAKAGRVLNIHGAMAHSPLLLDLYTSIERLLAERSSLGEQVRQAIHLTVAAVNDCDYCQSAYTGAARATGFTVEETIEIRRGFVTGRPDLTALLRLSREIAERRGHVDGATWETALAAGWSEEQLLEAYAEVVRTIFTNYFNHLVETEMDLPPAPPIAPRFVKEG